MTLLCRTLEGLSGSDFTRTHHTGRVFDHSSHSANSFKLGRSGLSSLPPQVLCAPSLSADRYRLALSATRSEGIPDDHIYSGHIAVGFAEHPGRRGEPINLGRLHAHSKVGVCSNAVDRSNPGTDPFPSRVFEKGGPGHSRVFRVG